MSQLSIALALIVFGVDGGLVGDFVGVLLGVSVLVGDFVGELVGASVLAYPTAMMASTRILYVAIMRRWFWKAHESFRAKGVRSLGNTAHGRCL